MVAELAEDDLERSFTDSSDESEGSDQKHLVHLQVWLGEEIGHKPLRGLLTDKPSELARNFAVKYDLSTSTRLDLQLLVAEKFKQHRALLQHKY